MICHGMHARCKNFFFQNMVRTDPRQPYPLEVCIFEILRTELELTHFRTEPNSSERSSEIVQEEVREICLRNKQIRLSRRKKNRFKKKKCYTWIGAVGLSAT
jgi:hypothetical protein